MKIEKMKEVTSQDNKFIKLARSLVLKKNRLEEGLYVADGMRVVEESLRHGEVRVCFISRSRLREIEKNAMLLELINSKSKEEIILVNDSLFTKIVHTETPQGIATLCSLPKYEYEEAETDSLDFKSQFIPILDGVSDPGNCGTIIRLAAGMGMEEIILTGASADPYGPKVVRASSGLISKTRIIYHRSISLILGRLKQLGYKILATDSTAEQTVRGYNFPEKAVLVLGGEASGISGETKDIADDILNIPVIDDVDSFNVATSAAIFFYEYVSYKHNPVSRN
jgi:TrmH family RNA methyltransferase